MGYYSEVTIICTKGIAEQINEVIETYKLMEKPKICMDTTEQYTRFVWDFIKWYTLSSIASLPREVEAILDQAEAEDDGEAFVFLRVGEESGDIEHRIFGEGTPIESMYPVVYLDGDLSFDGKAVMTNV